MEAKSLEGFKLYYEDMLPKFKLRHAVYPIQNKTFWQKIKLTFL